MSRYVGIEELTFGGAALPLPLSLHLSRQVAALPAGGDNDFFATSVQLSRPTLMAEARIRDTAAAEGLSLGRREDLSFTVAASDGQQRRRITLAGAVLIAMELHYEQAAVAAATLRFLAEADDGGDDPFAGEELP